MRIQASLLLALVTMLSTANGQSSSARPSSTPAKSDQEWSLPQGTTVKDSGPRTYRFTVVYNVTNTRGVIVSRQSIAGD